MHYLFNMKLHLSKDFWQLPAYWWGASAPQLEILWCDCLSRGINELMCLGVKILGTASFRLIILIPQNRAFALKKKTFAHNTHAHTRACAGDCLIAHCLTSCECLSVSLIDLQLPGVGGCSGLCCQTRGHWVSCRWLGRMRPNYKKKKKKAKESSAHPKPVRARTLTVAWRRKNVNPQMERGRQWSYQGRGLLTGGCYFPCLLASCNSLSLLLLEFSSYFLHIAALLLT